MQKKAAPTFTKKGQANPNDPDEQVFSDEEPSADQIHPTKELEEVLNAKLAKAQSDFDSFTQNDQSLMRKDTIEVCIDILNRVKAIGTEINEKQEPTRERLYYLTFNSTILIFKICSKMRMAGYAKEATHYLAFNMLCLDNNLILTTVKYLDWRVLNYCELGRAYADMKAFKAAVKVISYGLTKVLYSKKIEEQDPPVPEGSKETLVEALRVLRVQELKYQLQSGALNPVTWKAKIQEVFSMNKYHRSLAIVECLSLNDVMNCHLIDRTALHMELKQTCLKSVLELVMPDIVLVKNALIQIHQKKQRDKEKKEKLQARAEEQDLEQLLQKYKELDAEMIKEKDWKFASYNVPVEVHIEMIKLCIEAKMWTEFDDLLDPALVRLKFRRYEVPYLATIDVQMSSTKISNIPNGFERLHQDLNISNLRTELKKLRATAKMGSGDADDEKPEKGAKKKEAPKEVAKVEEKKVDPKAKGAPLAKDASKAPTQLEAPPPEKDDVVATQKELDIINHVYVYMMLQRTKSSQNAIVGVDVVMADETIGPNISASHYAVAVPIRQHPGSYQKTKTIPYIVFRRTANSLIDEEDCLSIVTDVQIIMGQDRNLRAPLGYTKINVDLRQTPADLERVPNLDYVFVCYKTDKQLALAERDLLIFRRLAELERSYVAKDSENFKNLPEEFKYLLTTYSLENLGELSRTVKEALLGPLGDFYLEKRRDILEDLSLKLYAQYILPVLQRIDVYVEMRNQKEYYGEFVQLLDQHTLLVKQKMVEACDIIHRILSRASFIENIILYNKFSIYYANLLEDKGDFRSAVQVIRQSIQKLIEYREEKLKASLDQGDSVTTSMCITVDNRKIGEIELQIFKITGTWRELILRKERDLERKQNENAALDDLEGDEEQVEVRQMELELQDKDLFEKEINQAKWHDADDARKKTSGKKYYSEQDMLVVALHTDLIVCLYRCEVKLGKENNSNKQYIQKTLTQSGMDLQKHAPGNLTKNLSESLTKKLTLAKSSKTLANNKTALKDLQHTLQEAGKLPPQMPQQLSYEKVLEAENNQNPYNQALLYMSLAASKSNSVSQKSLLLESLEYLKKAKECEDQMAASALENAVQIQASRKFHSYFGYSPDQVVPYNLLSKAIYIKKTPVPSQPIMIARTSTTITMKLPFYKPITEYKSWRNIQQVALYGKPSGSGVAVSLNNTDYEGTGKMSLPGQIVHVKGLICNEKYVFAAGGYTPEGVCVNGIGETCKEVITLLPLSLHQLNGYLAEIAFKLGHYQIAKIAAENVCTAFITKNEFKYAFLDVRINPVMAVRLNTSYLNLVSAIEGKQVAESFIILAKVQKILKNETQKRAEERELKIESQKIDMKVANYLLIALDISLLLNRAILVKRIVSDIFNHLLAYFSMQNQSLLLLQIVTKCHQALREIPQELIDSTTRRILACLNFQIVRLGFQANEDSLLRKIMLSELPINTRKWRKYSQYITFHPKLDEQSTILQNAQNSRILAGGHIPDSELIKDLEPTEQKQIKFAEFEVEGSALEEFLLTLGDYSDVVRAKTERWKTLVSSFQKQAHDGEAVVEKEQRGLAEQVEFWDGLKLNSPVAQLTQLCAAVEASPRLLEFCCKCIRRAMEQSDFKIEELIDLLMNKVKIDSKIEADVVEMIVKRFDLLQQDIVLKQRHRFEKLELEVKILLEQKALNGGNNKITQNQLKKIMTMTSKGVQGGKTADQSLNQQVIIFETEEEEHQKTYDYVWVSEKYFLQGICIFLQFAQLQPQRNVLSLPQTPNCVFDDIIRLDFTRFKSVMTEYQDAMRAKKQQAKDENKVVQVEDRVNRVSNFLAVMAQAAQFALNSRSWLQLVSIIQYVWNVFSYDLTSPLELTETSAWKNLTAIAECSLYLLEYLQQGGKLRKVVNREIDQVKNQNSQLKKNLKKTQFRIDEQSDAGREEQKANQSIQNNESSTAEETAGEEKKEPETNAREKKWFEKISDFDVTMMASFVSYTVQSLMCVGMWESLVDISNRLNQSTENAFASQLLPFIIFAQTTLYEQAATMTLNKKRALDSRIQQFENWKIINKKKKSRQAMITGEIPPEEQEFINDKAILEKEIFRLDVIENVLLADKDASYTLLENLKRDANNCDEALKACRKLYFQFGVETQSLKFEELKKGCIDQEVAQNYEIKSKRKSYKVFTSMAITSYKKCIDLLRKRQENFLLIQALHELGNLNYADGNLAEAEVQWNDCVDTIFQRLYVVSQFRQVFKANPNLADSFGSRQVLIGGIVLTKLAKFCYESKDLQKYMEASAMASELFAAPAKLTLPHPQNYIEYNSYQFAEYLDGTLAGETPLFDDKQVIQPAELLHSLYVITQTQIDLEQYHQVLPLASLMEFIASRIARSSVLTIKARISKALALIELGYLNEAYQIYKKILLLKNLPKQGQKGSDFVDRLEGPRFNLNQDDCYYNDLTPENDKNQPVIAFITKTIELDVLGKLKAFCSPYIIEKLQFLRASFMIRLGENQNVENLDKSEARRLMLKSAEDIVRLSLQNIQSGLTILKMTSEIKQLKALDVNNSDDNKTKLEQQLAAYFTSKDINKTDQTVYYTNTEEEMCFADSRCQLLQLLMRERAALGRIYRKQGLSINAYYVLKQSLVNFKLIVEGWTLEVENGAEPKEKGSFELPEMYGGTLATGSIDKKGGAAKKEAAPAKGKVDPKAKGAAAVDPAIEEAQLKAAEEAVLKKTEESKTVERLKIEAQNKRKHPHIILWLKIKIDLTSLLFTQKRFEDCSDTIAVTKLECMAIKDQFFIRRLDEIDFMMQVYTGQTQQALIKGRELRIHAQKYFHNDQSYAEFLGNFSELMYNIDKREEAVEVIKEGRLIVWYKLRDYGIEIDPQNINAGVDVFVDQSRKQLSEDALKDFQTPQASVAVTGAPGGKAPAKAAAPIKGKDPKSAVVTQDKEVEDERTDALPNLDFQKQVKYDLAVALVKTNNTSIAPNIYLLNLNLAIRFDVRYSQYCLVIQQKPDLAKKVLSDTQKLIERALYPSPQLKFHCSYLLGLASQRIFQEDILRFQSKFSSLKKYKESLINHIPYGSFALGEYLIELPGFNVELKDNLIPLLKQSLEQFEKAVNIGKQECCHYEFDFNLRHALQGLSEIHFYLAEYRQRTLEYKHAKYLENDKARLIKNLKEKQALAGKSNDDINMADIQKDLAASKWEEAKETKEKVAVFNHRKASVHYFDSANIVSVKQRVFVDSQHTLASTNLLDPTKVPKEVVSEMFESSMVAKIVHSKLPGFEFKDKTTLTSAEVLAYLKAVLIENKFFSFGQDKERFSNLISKLHRYLKTAHSAYTAQVAPDIKMHEETTALAQADLTKILPPSAIRSSWVDMQNKNSYLFYILGAEDPSLKKSEPPLSEGLTELPAYIKEARTKILADSLYLHYGWVEASPVKLSELHQEVCDLIMNMNASEKLPSALNERDRKQYQKQFEICIQRLGSFFKAPILSEQDAGKEINCLELVRDYIPALTVANVKKLAEILRKESGCSQLDPNFNAIMRKFHRVRFAN